MAEIAMVVVVAAMFADATWGGASVLSIIALTALVAAAFLTVAAEER